MYRETREGPRNSIGPTTPSKGVTRTSTPSTGEPVETRGRDASPDATWSAGRGIERHGSSGRTIVTASVASAKPYAGQNANGRKPTGANASANRNSVSARTDSDPR